MPWWPFGGGKKDDTATSSSSSSSKSQKTVMRDPTQRITESLETLEKREAVLSRNIDKELTAAKEASSQKKRDKALLHLKRKKGYQDQLDRLLAQKANIEGIQMKLEEAVINNEVFTAQKAGAQELQKAYGKMTVEKVEEEMDKIRETIDDAEEVSQRLAQPLGQPIADDADLEDEFAKLEQDLLNDQLGAVPVGKTKLPSVSPPVAVAQPNAEEDELNALEAELNS